MKLIEILVHELPKRGGWPDDAEYCWQDWDKEIRPGSKGFGFYINELAENNRSKGEENPVPGDDNCVTREQYEAALAAIKTEWDGEGLPPVGVECEFKANDGSWGIGTVLCVGKNRIFWLCHEDGDEYTSEVSPREFRPIRSEAGKKKEALLSQIASAIIGDVPDTGIATAAMYAERIYDAIKSGKIVID
ncbi:hypothetical protein [Enterobacter oligotrophicus]|uniref:hypothetical protein n=1 Tax=Enterobacter oligotrophicus TaxID=2478464 RepID=UPI0028AAD4D5|nr:hypothetical protein [Enterobacter oligotrophicus]